MLALSCLSWFPPPRSTASANTGGTRSAKKYVTASCVAPGTTISLLPGAASARNCSTSATGVMLSSAPATNNAVTGFRASSVVVSNSAAGTSKTPGSFFNPARSQHPRHPAGVFVAEIQNGI